MPKEFTQIHWNAVLAEECRRLVRRAMQEDLQDYGDLTTLALVAEDCHGRAAIVGREEIVVAGLSAAQVVLTEYQGDARLIAKANDGDIAPAGAMLAEIDGSARTLLTAERVLLNIVGRLSGIATLTKQYVDAVSHTQARVYDTRKTTPGWRMLEKYAVGCGGGMNHRTGLFDAVLIKDNHLAFGAGDAGRRFTAPEAVQQSRQKYCQESYFRDLIIEVEVDTLEQLAAVLPARPDIVLLDNMPPETLAQAVALRNATAAEVQLEASGGVTIDTIRGIAATGVDRISVGALTHSARCADVGLDWLD